MAAKKDPRIYPALIHYDEEDKGFLRRQYPDLPGCATVGVNMEIAPAGQKRPLRDLSILQNRRAIR
ncbi:hypothetical protein MASR1M66_20990 [Aminivibrio sp.]